MQDNNNFETIISKWRRLSVVEFAEHKEIVALASMSGDSSNHETLLKKKDDESALVAPEHSGGSALAATSTGVAIAVSEIPPDLVGTNQDEKQELIKRDTEDDKEAAGDTINKKREENTDNKTQTEKERDTEVKSEKEQLGDNVDSVFLRSPPPHKVRSSASTPQEEEDCGIKCLYYTLLCCDCVLM
ncbi:uncharacterized protein LOC120636013 isoform X2 [Pararge aegeria]|uniref:Jg24593 protein n=1 Tax=Pararge aegeria aegeria TaxID=348720 RepID=A0A8S4SK55_9NEOP|nr:uncharacterized protein LOC120636013 isoform X2 [Pararge aegeria]CAH2269881.1 jg24593 [Pararge aegeria aegeria]